MYLEWKYLRIRMEVESMEVDFTTEIQLKEVAHTSHHNIMAIILYAIQTGSDIHIILHNIMVQSCITAIYHVLSLDQESRFPICLQAHDISYTYIW